jgi:hypothetical protein
MVPPQALCHGQRPWGDRDQLLHLLRCQPQAGPYGCILRERPHGGLDLARVGMPGLSGLLVLPNKVPYPALS